MRSAGWYRIAGDPPDTFHYWDGVDWTGMRMTPVQRAASDPMPATAESTASAALPDASSLPHETARQTVGSYDLISPMDAPDPAGAMQRVLVDNEYRTRPFRRRRVESRSVRLLMSGCLLLLLGGLLGISGHNMATLLDTPTETAGTVTDSRISVGRRGRVDMRFEVTTAVGEFYVSRTLSEVPADMRRALDENQVVIVTVHYSERTGGLVAIDELGIDTSVIGRFFWPLASIAALVWAAVRLRYEFTVYRDRMIVIFVIIFVVIGPVVGWFAVEPLDFARTWLYDRP